MYVVCQILLWTCKCCEHDLAYGFYTNTTFSVLCNMMHGTKVVYQQIAFINVLAFFDLFQSLEKNDTSKVVRRHIKHANFVSVDHVLCNNNICKNLN